MTRHPFTYVLTGITCIALFGAITIHNLAPIEFYVGIFPIEVYVGIFVVCMVVGLLWVTILDEFLKYLLCVISGGLFLGLCVYVAREAVVC